MSYSNNPLGFLEFKPEGPWLGQRGEAGFDRPFPGEGLTGGEVWVGGNGVEVDAVPWRHLGREMREGGGWSTASGGLRGSEHGGGVAPVGFGRGDVVWELREGEAVLARGSERAEERR